ncbi:carbohydrate-binding protein [Roseateles amylovorans]|uniref:Carbohydrate-binding protein n=1 Tax=Roseateles amylovorans TaxID=2978473 RepID=A0ABY6B8D9_9BURK|nr:carbohydrate-binding protein [Roseateles amylovorans]UXH80730.1 carbohydrate-binding protein [Roseateles amylovorans]
MQFISTQVRRAAMALCGGLMLAHAGVALADVSPLSVSGNKVLAGGQPASFAGNSLFWSNTGWGGEKYYNANVVSWLKNDWRSKVVRVAMGVDESQGYLSDPAANKARVKAVVDAAIANDMYVIIDWHSHHAEDYRAQAVSFFEEMARTYGKNNHVIYEVYNEPLNVSWSGTIKPYAQAVISAIRAIDPDNLIIVGTPNWSQDVDAASRDPISGANIAYTLHFYAGSHGQWLRDKAQTALNNGIALFVTEWGSVGASGDGGVAEGETQAWVDFMKAKGISNANWALNDKSEGASALVPGASAQGGWSAGQLTRSGALAKQIISGWSGTPQPPAGCSRVSVPAQIQAEAYCNMSGVQVETTTDTDGGSNVGYIETGDWMTYDVNVPTAGTYVVKYRVASASGGGVVQLERGGGGATYGTVNVGATGGWQNWTTVSHNVTLPAGQQTLAILAKSGGFNINWLDISRPGEPPATGTTIQAENFDAMYGVQTEATTDSGGGLNVGYLDAGDWLSYPTINVPTAGSYTVEYRVASLNGGGNLQLEEAGGSVVYGSVNIPATGGWQNWVTVKQTVQLPAGNRKFGIAVRNGGLNLNWFRVTKN